MKKKLLVFSLLLLMTFSSLSFGEWRLTVETEVTNFYWDPENIRKGNGLIYSWFLQDFREESPESDRLSMMINVETDCETLASKDWTYVSYKQHMAGGALSQPIRLRVPRLSSTP